MVIAALPRHVTEEAHLNETGKETRFLNLSAEPRSGRKEWMAAAGRPPAWSLQRKPSSPLLRTPKAVRFRGGRG